MRDPRLDLWLQESPKFLTRRLASRKPWRDAENGTLVLYDVTSTYFEGRSCPLARFGYNRDGKSGKLQIVFGLLCSTEGCPVAVEVFEGNVGDPSTLASQIAAFRSLKTGRYRGPADPSSLRPPRARPRVPVHARQLCRVAHAPGSRPSRSTIVTGPPPRPPAPPSSPRQSAAADRNALTKRTDDGLPAHSFRSLLGDLATVTRNTMAIDGQQSDQILAYRQAGSFRLARAAGATGRRSPMLPSVMGSIGRTARCGMGKDMGNPLERSKNAMITT
jgi:hypothetical protein